MIWKTQTLEVLLVLFSADEIENSEESEYFSPSTPGGTTSNYRYQRAATPNGRERKRVLR